MAKVTRITLVTTSEGVEEKFAIDHAERILAIKNSGWRLPDNSEYEYCNGTINRRNKKKSK